MDDFVNRLIGEKGTVTGYRVTIIWNKDKLGDYYPSDKVYFPPNDPARNDPNRKKESFRTRTEKGKRKNN